MIEEAAENLCRALLALLAFGGCDLTNAFVRKRNNLVQNASNGELFSYLLLLPELTQLLPPSVIVSMPF